ncbi:MAG: dUTP diphosphatase [Bacilli bacterium]|nr:dUTP diphosphatase [Bacilli bacterium]
MEINLAPLLIKQKELDARINTEHKVTHQSTKTERFLALLVEIGELANATRAFKYWSLKPGEERARLLDEFADGLHFFLSLAIVFNIEVDEVYYESSLTDKKTVVNRFKEVYQAIGHFMEKEGEILYFRALTSFLSLGSALAFTPQDINDAYLAKLVVNYTRQNTKY